VPVVKRVTAGDRLRGLSRLSESLWEFVDELIEDGVAQVAPPTRVERYNPQPDRIYFTYGLAARLIWQVTVMMSAKAWRGNNTELTLAPTAAAEANL
jgi:hypothetical protein